MANPSTPLEAKWMLVRSLQYLWNNYLCKYHNQDVSDAETIIMKLYENFK